jgi:transketolase
MRNIFPKFIFKELKKNKKIFILLGDIGVFGFRNVFEKYGKNILNLGVLEQSMISFAAGLALKGKIVFAHTIAPFLVNRALEQIKIDACYQNLNINIVSTGASLDYSALGSTHHCPDDVGVLMQIPNLKIYTPGNADEFLRNLKQYKSDSPKYFRMSSEVHCYTKKIIHNQSLIKKGSKGLIIVIGPAFRFIEKNLEKINTNIIYLNCIKPLNSNFINKFYKRKIMIIQDFYKYSLTGEIVKIFQEKDIVLKEIGLPKLFFKNYGKTSDHFKKLKLTEQDILKEIRNYFK